MRKLIVVVAVVLAVPLLFAGGPSFGEDVTVSWVNPDQVETCTPAGPYTDPAGTKIYQLVMDVADPAAEEFVLTDVKPGDYTYVARAYSATGNHSKLSGSADRTVTEFVVTNIVVKIISKIPGRFLLLGVGTVPLGTACDITQGVNGHYVVPQDDVVWSDPARNAGTATLPLVVVAQCG